MLKLKEFAWINKDKKMPQLNPIYFVNQITFNFLVLTILIYMFSKYILPRDVLLFTARNYISKLI